MYEIFTGVLLASIISLMLAINDYDYSQPNEHYFAEEICVKNGGYKEIGYSFLRDYKIVCNDNATHRRSYSDFNDWIASRTE